jgi:hypothetical protein
MTTVLADLTSVIRARVGEFNEKAGRGSGFREEKINDSAGQALAWTKATFPAALIKVVEHAPDACHGRRPETAEGPVFISGCRESAEVWSSACGAGRSRAIDLIG